MSAAAAVVVVALLFFGASVPLSAQTADPGATTSAPLDTVRASSVPDPTTPPPETTSPLITVPFNASSTTTTTVPPPGASPAAPGQSTTLGLDGIPFIGLPPDLTDTAAAGETTTSTTTTTTIVTTTTEFVVPLGLDVLDEGPAGERPPTGIVVPPLPIIRNEQLEAELAKLTEEQQKIVIAATIKAEAARQRVLEARARLVRLENEEFGLIGQRDLAKERYEDKGAQMRERAVRAYTGERAELLDFLLGAADVSALLRRADLVASAQRSDAAVAAAFKSSEDAFNDKTILVERVKFDRQRQIGVLQNEQLEVEEELQKVADAQTFVDKGRAIALGGFVFPVAANYKFSDTFLAPRMVGSKYYHLHQGVDIFAPYGMPLRSVVRGVIAKKGQAVLGGNKLWIAGQDGTAYYYAHLSGFAEGIEDGVVVNPGDVIGYVGDTGNARGTPPHLHFEIHPGGEDAINPYPILAALERSTVKPLLELLLVTTTTSTTSTTAIPSSVPSSIPSTVP